MDWKIAKPLRECQCGRAFDEGDTYVAALFEQDDEFVRRDYCPACWDAAQDKDACFSFWRATVPPKEEKRRLFADDSVLVDFFFRLEPETDEQKRHFFYLLALILMRKKVLKFEDIERQDDAEFLILRMPSEDRTFRVLDPKLSEEQTGALQEQLGQILDIQL
jgi:hypothetical protein